MGLIGSARSNLSLFVLPLSEELENRSMHNSVAMLLYQQYKSRNAARVVLYSAGQSECSSFALSSSQLFCFVNCN